MTNLEIVKKKLYETNASLVVLYSNGECKEYYQNRIKDIKEIVFDKTGTLTKGEFEITKIDTFEKL